MSGRRRGLKGVVDQELLTRGIEQEQQKIEAKQRARVAGRFGLDLLGEDADEETMIAYAQLLSQEEQERKLLKATAKTLPYDATPEEIEEHMRTLSEEELARFKFASWPKRLEMSTSGSSSIGLGSPSVTTSPHVSGDNDLARALELSMQENKLTPPLTPPRPSGSRTSAVDDDFAEGIRRSLDTNHSRALASPWASPKLREEDELERAIRPSLESADNASSSSAHMKKHRENSIDLGDEGDLPALSSSPQSSPPWRERCCLGHREGEGKGLVTQRSFCPASFFLSLRRNFPLLSPSMHLVCFHSAPNY